MFGHNAQDTVVIGEERDHIYEYRGKRQRLEKSGKITKKISFRGVKSGQKEEKSPVFAGKNPDIQGRR